ncbi:M20 family metallopeptidase [Acidaminobacter sp. JC074]|uniref:M20 family metallopeptidase n=1 Tax=Acidaminobacter sp. JC074 TaxID=2530199 RepID=UPI001F113682|nr:M20 family metallopeptidase [Acidaminobacter sp. JC074]MCH4886304.1 M20 family metallopeptidase [Acidaminobacter sp. JC074]
MSLKEKYIYMIEENQLELLDLASSLIRIPSENPSGMMDAVVEYILGYLKASNIDVEIAYCEKDFPNIIASIGHDEDNLVILNGHADVVPVGDINKWGFDPFSGDIVDDKLRGRGTSDMKAGLAGLIYAMKIIKESGLKVNGKLELHVVTDEESGGQYGSKWLMSKGYGKNAKACIIAEPTPENNIEVGQKGSLNIRVETYGVSAHGSIGNYVGENAIEKMMTILPSLHKLRDMKGIYKKEQLHVLEDSKKIARESLKVEGSENVIDHVAVNIGLINGGIKDNMVPDYCVTDINCRLPIGLTCSDVEKRTRQIVDSLNLQGVKLTFEYNCEANYTDDTTSLVKSVKSNAEYIWGAEVTPAYQWATSDARYYRYENIPTIQFGPANLEGIHSYNEDVDLDDIIKSTQVYVGVLFDLLGLSE